MTSAKSTPARATPGAGRRARIKDQPSGQALVKLLQDSPLRDLKIEWTRARSRIRPVKL